MSDEEIDICPYCRSSSLSMNAPRGGEGDADRYRCASCYKTFDDPDTREEGDGGGVRGSLAATLEQISPDEV